MDEYAPARAVADELDRAYAHWLTEAAGDEHSQHFGRIEGLAQALSIVRGTHYLGELTAVRIRAGRRPSNEG